MANCKARSKRNQWCRSIKSSWNELSLDMVKSQQSPKSPGSFLHWKLNSEDRLPKNEPESGIREDRTRQRTNDHPRKTCKRKPKRGSGHLHRHRNRHLHRRRNRHLDQLLNQHLHRLLMKHSANTWTTSFVHATYPGPIACTARIGRWNLFMSLWKVDSSVKSALLEQTVAWFGGTSSCTFCFDSRRANNLVQ